MRTAPTCLILIATLLCGLASPAKAEIAWEKGLRKAYLKASHENKLMLLHFVRDNCIYCDKLEAGAFQSADVQQTINQGFVPLKINVSDSKGNRKLAEQFKVDRFPMDVIVTTDGEAKAHGVSPQHPERYVSMLVKSQSPSAPSLNRPGSRSAAPAAIAGRQTPTAVPARPDRQPAVPGYAAQDVPTAPGYRVPGQGAPGNIAPGRAAPHHDAATYAAPQLASTAAAAGPALSVQTRENPHAAPPRAPDQTPPQNRLVSSRMQHQSPQASLSAPPQATGSISRPSHGSSQNSAFASPGASPSDDQPTLAMEGFCSVSVNKESRWVEGKPDFGVVHLGKLYLFASEAAMNEFLADPSPYTPVLNEIDVVRFFEERVVVPGKREWAVKDPTYQRMFFFADEEAMKHFENEYARYVDAAIQVMDKAVSEANPGS